MSGAEGDTPGCHSNAFPFLEVHLLFCCPSSWPQVWCWSWSPLYHAIKKEWKEVCPQQERVSLPCVQVPFPGRLSSVSEGDPKVTPGLRKSAESGIFFGSDSGCQVTAFLKASVPGLSWVLLPSPPQGGSMDWPEWMKNLKDPLASALHSGLKVSTSSSLFE